jgi:hypothetical protein
MQPTTKSSNRKLRRRCVCAIAAAAFATMLAPATAEGAYRWPVTPFGEQHPVRGFFGDPRIGDGGHHQFHFGVDVSAPNGTPVYATLTGRVRFIHDDAIAVSDGGRRAFEYWHIRPAVQPGQFVTAFRTVVGHVEKPWAHVHFSETLDGRYVNPLRPGAMGPYVDATRPRVTRVIATPSGAVLADVADTTPIAVPEPWANLPVMPALVRWRLVGRTAGHWTTAADFRWTIPSADSFFSVFAAVTRQNHARRPGLYRLRLAVRPPERPGLQIQILLADVSGNRSLETFLLGRSGVLLRASRA